MDSQPQFLGNNSFLHIGNDLVFLFGMQYSLVDFVADACRFVIDRTACVLAVVENISYTIA